MSREKSDSLVLSFSRLSAFKDCPYRCANAQRLDSPEATAADLGCVVHESNAVYHRSGYDAAIRHYHASAVACGLNTEQVNAGLEMIDRMSRNPFFQIDQSDIICVESDDGEIEEHGRKMFLAELPIVIGSKKVFLRGAFDLVIRRVKDGEMEIEIVDHKTGFAKGNEFQKQLYALASYLLYWRIVPIKVRFHYMRSGFTDLTVFDESDLSGILQHVAILANAYATETEWAPRFNTNCGDCEFRTGCNAYLDAMSKLPDVPKIDPENWEAILKWEAHLKAIEKCAKKWSDELDDAKRNYLKNHGETKMPTGQIAYLGEKVTRYGIPFETVSANIGKYLDLAGMIEYVSPSDVEGFLDKKIVEGKIDAATAAKLLEILEKQKVPTSKTETIKFKGDKKKTT